MCLSKPKPPAPLPPPPQPEHIAPVVSPASETTNKKVKTPTKATPKSAGPKRKTSTRVSLGSSLPSATGVNSAN